METCNLFSMHTVTGARKGKERATAFHVNTNLLCTSALWLFVCLSCGFTHTYTLPTSHSSTSAPLLSCRWTNSSGKTEHRHVPLIRPSQKWILHLVHPHALRRYWETSCNSSILLAPLVEWAVLSSRWTCFAWGNSASSASLANASLSKEWGLYVLDFTWLQGESCNDRINVRFPNIKAISTRVLYLHCTHTYTHVAHSFPLCIPAYNESFCWEM